MLPQDDYLVCDKCDALIMAGKYHVCAPPLPDDYDITTITARALVGIEKQLIELNKFLRQDHLERNRAALDAIEREFGVKL